MKTGKLVIIGGGPAGLAAAVSAKENGIENILIIERDHHLGGILNQCIHNGFGLHTFKEELSGPEYASRYVDMVLEKQIPYLLNTMVISISEKKTLTLLNREKGVFTVKAESIILAMGCRERPRGALNIPGYRPAGIYSAGTAQYLINVEGYMPGKEVVILGSGDIGLIMARRMTLEGAHVHGVAEIMPYSSGLNRNKVQCLDDYGIPLLLNTTIVRINGKNRVTSVVLAQVDEQKKPILGTEKEIICDTLLLSCGLIPENELSEGMGLVMDHVTAGPQVNESLETSVAGVFSCGNVLHVHDLADNVSSEATQAGQSASQYLQNTMREFHEDMVLQPMNGVRYTVPMKIDRERMQDKVLIRFRVNNNYRNRKIVVSCGNTILSTKRKAYLAPGEMEQVIVTKEQLLNCSSHTITIGLEE